MRFFQIYYSVNANRHGQGEERIMADVANCLTSPSLTKHKLQVITKRSQPFGEIVYHFIYLASDAARIVLLLNEKVMIKK